MKKTVLSVKNLTKQFGSFTAVNSISFSVARGEIVGFLGPNGAGKTTTIHMLLGLITPTSGTITIFDKNFSSHREEILKSMNFSSTYTQMPWRLTVRENLTVVALLYGIRNSRQKVNEVIELLHLAVVEKKAVGELSAGWMTRINIARIFLNDPKLVLLDEPTASLDPESAANIRAEILHMRKNRGTTILWTSHNMAEVEEVCDRVIFLQKGAILAEDTPQGLAGRIKTCRVSFMLIKGKQRFVNLTASHTWVVQDNERFVTVTLNESDIPSLLALLSTNDIQYAEISIDKPTLEDFFLSIRKELHAAT